MVAVKYLLFNFGEKVSFVNYCKKILNSSACRVLKTTLTRILFNLYKKVKKIKLNILKILMVELSYVPTYGVIIVNCIFT